MKQQYLCLREGVVVERADMVKGYEFSKDQYVTFTAEELKELEEKGTATVEITEFVPSETIDATYYDKAYYLAPDKGGAKPYALLAEGMRKTGRCAVGRWAARGKQYLVEIRPIAEGLVMQQLFYADEVRSISEVEIQSGEVKEAELNLAVQLIEQNASVGFNPAAYEDAVKKRIEAAIQQKVEGKEISFAEEAQPSAQVIDLMEALRASLSKGESKPAERKPAKPAAQPVTETASRKKKTASRK